MPREKSDDHLCRRPRHSRSEEEVVGDMEQRWEGKGPFDDGWESEGKHVPQRVLVQCHACLQ